jgi:phosphatidylinositol-3,4,5-trisphosphate 3-phosphatase/dual-specificity protein phosphatase PTEN
MIRTKNGKGVTIPSQIRYVQYFEQAIKSQWKPTTFPRHQVELATLTLSTSPRISIMGGCGIADPVIF